MTKIVQSITWIYTGILDFNNYCINNIIVNIYKYLSMFIYYIMSFF